MSTVLESYRIQAGEAAILALKYKKRAGRFSLLRLVCLLGGIGWIWFTFDPASVLLLEIQIVLVILIFFWLVQQQFKNEKLRDFYEALQRVNENEIGSISSNTNLYSNGSEFVDDNHAYSSDLDIFGPASIYALINRTSFFLSKELLASWLSAGADPVIVRQRQERVKEIAGKPAWRMHMQALLLQSSGKDTDEELKKLFRFLNMKETVLPAWLRFYAGVQAWLFLAAVLSGFFWEPLFLLCLLIVVMNAVLEIRYMSLINDISRLFAKAGKTFDKYGAAFASFEKETFVSASLSGLRSGLHVDGKALSGRLKRLSQLINNLDLRLNILISPFLILCFAWDIRQILAFARWKQENHHTLIKAFDVLAELETLMSLASLHQNNPDYHFPTFDENVEYELEAADLGHPLIVRTRRVTNDYKLGGTRRVDIITGSNMAGKSTFLRTLGINIVLSQAGSVVCAASMRLSPMDLFSYMRIKDSLNDSISTFRAELIRLEMLLERVRRGDKVFFLIDEMLRGTNSADKYKGSKAIIENMIGYKAVGIVATHDLQISELEGEYPGYVRNFYFDIQVEESDMHFDYKIREGACKTFNASMLLRQLGVNI